MKKIFLSIIGTVPSQPEISSITAKLTSKTRDRTDMVSRFHNPQSQSQSPSRHTLTPPIPQSLPPTYKPSPLSYGSPRTSPFKRPESPASPFRRPESPSPPSPANRPTTPTTSPTKPQQTPLTSPYKLQNNAPTPPSASGSWTPRGLTPSLTAREPPLSPTRTSSAVTTIAANQPSTATRPTAHSDALSKLPTSQVREMREGFQILDRDNDGLVNRDDVVDMLTNLGTWGFLINSN